MSTIAPIHYLCVLGVREEIGEKMEAREDKYM